MRLKIRLDKRTLRQWHVALLQRLADVPGIAIGVETVVGETSESQRVPHGGELLFELETLLHGLPRDGLAVKLPASALAPFGSFAGAAPADVTLDLCGDSTDEGRVWRLTFDGVAGEAALFAILLDGRVPHAAIMDGGTVVAAARFGTDYGGIALASFEAALARTASLIVAAVKGGGRQQLPAVPDETGYPAPVPPTTRRLAELATKRVATRVARLLYQLCCNSPHWRVGWRRLDGHDLIDLRRHPHTAWNSIPDDGSRFYADPFPVLHHGVVTLFVEDYAHRLGKGVISAVAFDAHGPIGQPRPVLEQPGHLSYPFVFEREGQMWMIPESCAAGSVELFRATAFPGGWVKEATLLSDVTASDPTLVEHAGTWWLFATVKDGGCFSDALYLWSAPDFRGPWTPHKRNPVLIDIASARPGGRMIHRGNALFRPVQDCRRGYGAALCIARVTRLDTEGFEQEIETRIDPGGAWPGRRLHTLNSAGGLEFIDGSAYSSRWVRRRMPRAALKNAGFAALDGDPGAKRQKS